MSQKWASDTELGRIAHLLTSHSNKNLVHFSTCPRSGAMVSLSICMSCTCICTVSQKELKLGSQNLMWVWFWIPVVKVQSYRTRKQVAWHSLIECPSLLTEWHRQTVVWFVVHVRTTAPSTQNSSCLCLISL